MEKFNPKKDPFMPTKELLALSFTILGGLFITHPHDFVHTVHKVEYSMLRELTRTDNWGNPSLFRRNKYTKHPHKIYSQIGK